MKVMMCIWRKEDGAGIHKHGINTATNTNDECVCSLQGTWKKIQEYKKKSYSVCTSKPDLKLTSQKMSKTKENKRNSVCLSLVLSHLCTHSNRKRCRHIVHACKYMLDIHTINQPPPPLRYRLRNPPLTCYQSSLSLSFFATTNTPTSECTYTHQYARGTTAGFRYIGAAAQIFILILMEKKGLWVQLQVTLRVAQEVGEMGKSPWKWRHPRHCNDEGFMGCFTRPKRGKRKGDICRELVMILCIRPVYAKSFPQCMTHTAKQYVSSHLYIYKAK